MQNIIFARDFVEVGDILTRIVDESSREVVYNLWDELVDATPVCSGKAAYSWWISQGIPKTRDILPEPPDVRRPSECVRIWDDPREEGRYLPMSGSGEYIPEYPRRRKDWVINNTAPYISELNAGTSKKAPAGFVEIAISKGLAKS